MVGHTTSTHGLLWVAGPDAVSFLDGQVTQDVAAMAPGSVARSLLLEPRGKLQGILWLLRGEDRVGIVTDAPSADRVRDDLNRFRFRVDAEITNDERPVHSIWVDSGAPGWSEEDGVLRAGFGGGAPSGIVAGTEPEGPLLGSEEVDRLRILAGEPLYGVDVDDGTIPQESGLVPESVSFSKGCYLGQELVARIDSRGHVNRHLRLLELAGPVPVGATVALSGGEVGSVTTVAGDLALGMVRREAGPGTAVAVRWDGGETTAIVREASRQALIDGS